MGFAAPLLPTGVVAAGGDGVRCRLRQVCPAALPDELQHAALSLHRGAERAGAEHCPKQSSSAPFADLHVPLASGRTPRVFCLWRWHSPSTATSAWLMMPIVRSGVPCRHFPDYR